MTDAAPEQDKYEITLANRFRGFLPVIVDVETGGFNPATDALLEIAAAFVGYNLAGELVVKDVIHRHVKPFEGANLEEASLKVNGIDPYHPLRIAQDEKTAMTEILQSVRREVKDQKCNRAVLVGHNAWFDLHFLNAAIERTQIKRNPFHPFSSFDTATLGGLLYGQTVLQRAAKAAGMSWDNAEAHSARYDTAQTAELFCRMVNSCSDVFKLHLANQPDLS